MYVWFTAKEKDRSLLDYLIDKQGDVCKNLISEHTDNLLLLMQNHGENPVIKIDGISDIIIVRGKNV